MGLSKYQAKRDVTATIEPRGDGAVLETAEKIFVIQKHEASRLQFDLRLEADGVLESWAVPKRPSSDPSVKRLTVEVGSHGLSSRRVSPCSPIAIFISLDLPSCGNNAIVVTKGFGEPNAAACVRKFLKTMPRFMPGDWRFSSVASR